jgi:hypothetical protein
MRTSSTAGLGVLRNLVCARMLSSGDIATTFTHTRTVVSKAAFATFFLFEKKKFLAPNKLFKKTRTTRITYAWRDGGRTTLLLLESFSKLTGTASGSGGLVNVVRSLLRTLI